MKVYTEAEYDRLYEETLSDEQIKANTSGFDLVETSKKQIVLLANLQPI